MKKSRIEFILGHTLNEINRVNEDILYAIDIGLEEKYVYKVHKVMFCRDNRGDKCETDLKLTEHEISEITKAVESHLKQLKL